LLRGESLSGHPEGAKAPEGPPTILMGRRSYRSEGRPPERSKGCLANARQDKRRVARQDKRGCSAGQKRGCSAGQMGSKGIATLMVASARQQKMSFSNAE
jgi:hypothetical protein